MNRRELLGNLSGALCGLTHKTANSGERDPLADDTYRNPVYEHVFPDPDVLRVGGTYYTYGTYHPWTPGEGPEQELIPILQSPNLVDWEFVRPAFAEKPDWSRYRGLWAPGVGRLSGRILLYYSDAEFGASNEGIGVATAQTPTGPFEPQGGLLRSRGIGVPNSIDPMLFVGEDAEAAKAEGMAEAGEVAESDEPTEEQPVLFWGSKQGIYGLPLTPDGLDIAGEKFRVASDGVEAPYVVERGDYFYLFGSRGTCCRGALSSYHVVVGRAESLRGPYRNRAGGRLTAESATGTTILEENDRFAGPGHCAVVRDDHGGWWMLYHAYERRNPWVGDTPRRVLMLDRVRWQDGWPVVGDEGTPSARANSPPVEE